MMWRRPRPDRRSSACAIWEPSYARRPPSRTILRRTRASTKQLLDALFARGAVLPAPPGLVFRTADTLRAWMEQNYVGLAEGAHASSRDDARRACTCAPRVTDDRRGDRRREAGGHRMRSARCATAPWRRSRCPSRQPPVLVSVAFLLKANEWNTFSESVLEQERRYHAAALRADRPVDPARFRAAGPRGLSDVLS